MGEELKDFVVSKLSWKKDREGSDERRLQELSVVYEELKLGAQFGMFEIGREVVDDDGESKIAGTKEKADLAERLLQRKICEYRDRGFVVLLACGKGKIDELSLSRLGPEDKKVTEWSLEDWVTCGNNLQAKRTAVESVAITEAYEEVGLNKLLTGAHFVWNDTEGEPFKSGVITNLKNESVGSLRFNLNDQPDEKVDQFVFNAMIHLKAGRWKFFRGEQEVTDQVKEGLERLQIRDDFSRAYYDHAARMKDVFEKTARKSDETRMGIYREWAGLAKTIDQVYLETSEVDDRWVAISSLVEESNLDEDQKQWFLATHGYEVMNQKIRQVYAEDFLLSNDRHAGDRALAKLLFGFQPQEVAFNFVDSGSTEVVLGKSEFKRVDPHANFWGARSGALFQSHAPVAIFMESLSIFPSNQHHPGDIAHENAHRQHYKTAADVVNLRFNSPGNRLKKFASPEANGGKNLKASLMEELSLYRPTLKSEILAYKENVGRGEMSWGEVERILTERYGIYDYLQMMVDKANLTKSQAFEVAFVRPKEKVGGSLEEAMNDVWAGHKQEVLMLIQIAKEIDDKYLLAAAPVRDWELMRHSK